ncbi:Amino-acid acetyltransferase, mitochondrial [Allomyces arbusculus]|nr:Amino-acid acetyltransferase, mitochondrial [Allomyces arbusculus]
MATDLCALRAAGRGRPARWCHASPSSSTVVHELMAGKQRVHRKCDACGHVTRVCVTQFTATTSDALVHRILAAGAPTPREAASYLRRYQVPPPGVSTTSQQQFDVGSGAPPWLAASDSATDDTSSAIHVALVHLAWPLPAGTASSVAADLAAMARLAVHPVVVVHVDPPTEDDAAPSTTTDPVAAASEFRASLTDAASHVARLIDLAGHRARPVSSGLFITTPTSLDIDLAPLRSCLALGHTPVIAPLAHDWSTGRTVSVPAGHATVALAHHLAQTPAHPAAGAGGGPQALRVAEDPDAVLARRIKPVKLVVLNKADGGVPPAPGARGVGGRRGVRAAAGVPAVNLANDAESLRARLPAGSRAVRDLDLVEAALSGMPATATAVVAAAADAGWAAVAHVLTDKPRPAASKGGSSGAWPPTVIRAGPKVVVHTSTATLDKAKVVDLLESAFGRSLDVDTYFARLDTCLHAAVIAGDYAGAAIVTRESPGGGCMYLDKLAVHPRQTAGGGLVDVVWRGLREVCPKELVWRSRGNNPVNAWYFDRADGMVKLGNLPEGEKCGWTVFWYGPERVDEYVEVARGVPASFV